MKRKVILSISLVFLLFGSIGAFYLLSKDSVDLNKAYGMVDIRQAALAFDIQGRIVKLNVDEGDLVKKGDVLAVLDTKALDHQIAISKAKCSALKASLDELLNGYQKEDINKAYANVNNLKNALALSQLTYERYQKLFLKKAASAQDRDKAFFEKEQLKAQYSQALNEYEKLKGGYRSESIREKRSELESCNSEIAYLVYQKDDQSLLKAPFSGQIRSRFNEIGDMTSTNTPVFELSVINEKRVRVYLSEKQLSHVHINDKAYVLLPNKTALEGKVAFISNSAMFTPKTVQTEDLRPDLVYEVKVLVNDENAALRLGQSVTVEFNHE